MTDPFWDVGDDENIICPHCGGIDVHSIGCPRGCDCDTCEDEECECECHISHEREAIALDDGDVEQAREREIRVMKQPYRFGTFAVRECAVGLPDGGEATHWHVENKIGEGFVCRSEKDARAYAFGMTVIAEIMDQYPDVYAIAELCVKLRYPRDDKETLKLNSNGKGYVWE